MNIIFITRLFVGFMVSEIPRAYSDTVRIQLLSPNTCHTYYLDRYFTCNY